jgi:hypothetical protein
MRLKIGLTITKIQMKTIKIRNLKTNKMIEMKPYLIGDIPNSFNKYKDVYFNKNGITYIEKKESFWDAIS